MRESLEFDVVIVGAGPAGLSTACKLMQMAQAAEKELSVCVIEKGSEVGAHILSGSVIETRALSELFPDWSSMDSPLSVPVSEDRVVFLNSEEQSTKIPHFLVPSSMHNDGNMIASVGDLCRWLAEQAEALGVDIFPGFAAAEVLYHEDGRVKGVATADMGIGADGKQKQTYMPGMELHANYTVFSEGCRGHLGKQLIERFNLNRNTDPQHYAIGLKELWEVDETLHTPGLVIHGAGWPLSSETSGGFFLYHGDKRQVMLGLIVDLNYKNPYLSPFDELQRLKHHPVFKQYLQGGKRLSYGARAIAKGGFNSLPTMTVPGGMLIGCDAGTLNFSKIKGTHTAMKSGLLAAETLFEVIDAGCDEGKAALDNFDTKFKQSWLYDELYRARNFGPALHKFGSIMGGAFNFIDQNLCKGRLPFTLKDTKEDYECLVPIAQAKKIDYPKPDGQLSFDKLSSVFISNTNHEEDQPCHLQLIDSSLPIEKHLPIYDEPAQRYCPAGVYELIEDEEGIQFKINAQNCLHCKTCDIKDPSQNIQWVVPEGAGGPNYPNM